MNSTIAVILTLTYIVIVSVLVIKKYNSVFVFMMSGSFVLLMSALITGNSILGDKTTGNAIIDVFTFVANSFKSNASGVGLTLMMVTGYAVYMSHIGPRPSWPTLRPNLFPKSKILISYSVCFL